MISHITFKMISITDLKVHEHMVHIGFKSMPKQAPGEGGDDEWNISSVLRNQFLFLHTEMFFLYAEIMYLIEYAFVYL